MSSDLKDGGVHSSKSQGRAHQARDPAGTKALRLEQALPSRTLLLSLPFFLSTDSSPLASEILHRPENPFLAVPLPAPSPHHGQVSRKHELT